MGDQKPTNEAAMTRAELDVLYVEYPNFAVQVTAAAAEFRARRAAGTLVGGAIVLGALPGGAKLGPLDFG